MVEALVEGEYLDAGNQAFVANHQAVYVQKSCLFSATPFRFEFGIRNPGEKVFENPLGGLGRSTLTADVAVE
jgi:hypothetical protein